MASAIAQQLESLKQMPERFDQLAMRERALVAAAVLIVTFMLWLVLVDDSIEANKQRATQAIANANSSIHAEIASQNELRELQARAPNDRLRERREALKEKLARIATLLEKTVSDFVDPVQMPILLEEVFARHSDVKLLRVINLEPQPLQLENQSEPTGMYRHVLQLEMEGSYFEVMQFLADVESSRWGLRWRSIDYAVTDYPKARVMFEVETLSREPNVLGV